MWLQNPHIITSIGFHHPSAGDYGWKVISSADPETKKRKLNAELANGRLAMSLEQQFQSSLIWLYVSEASTAAEAAVSLVRP